MKLEQLNGIGPAKLKALQAARINTTLNLINFIPRAYIDRSKPVKIKDVFYETDSFTSIATLSSKKLSGKGRQQRLEALFFDGTGTFKAVWFKGVSYFNKSLVVNQDYLIWGKLKQYGRYWSVAHPNIEAFNPSSGTHYILPIYPSNQFFDRTHITSTAINSWVKTILDNLSWQEWIPNKLIKGYNLVSREEAYKMLHTPNDINDVSKGLYRLKFEELLLFQLSVQRLRAFKHLAQSEIIIKPPFELANHFRETLPFELTDGQKSTLKDIVDDFSSGKQMHRLIQGDVGAGKTVVAIFAMLFAADNGFQSAFMAPTEILAEQHAITLRDFLDPLNVRTRLLTGSHTQAQRREILNDIHSGNASVLVGTHAIFQDEVNYNSLGLVIIDEQHRFGVMQRNKLLQKARNPHLLVMSATPIPRSLALTIYGDLDVSLIKMKPAGRIPIKTAVRYESQREDVYRFLESVVHDKGQAYIVYPLVEESEVLDLKDATKAWHDLTLRFPDFNIGLVHGKMKSDEKEAIMSAFKQNDLHILVSTTVIEVGVDIPNASVMIIEHAERFGLSQLHQLRGRVGRGSTQSYCILMTYSSISEDARFRLKTMRETNDGFKIAEADLKLRGPGDLLGTKQSGLPDFKFADIVNDQDLMSKVRLIAYSIMLEDPDLESETYSKMRSVFFSYFKKRMDRFGLS